LAKTPDSVAVTEGIRVHAAAHYLPDESDPTRPLHVYAYRIVITNVDSPPARLESRHWIIVDANGERRDVRGPGVVGEFPTLAAGESFEYVSRCPLTTTWGSMEGTYRFRRTDGSPFDVRVGRFFLIPTARALVQRTS